MRATTKHQSASWASEVQTFWPSTTQSSPSSRGLRRDVREVGAGAGLGVPLAPQLLDRRDPRQEALLLLLGAEGDQGRSEQLLTEVVDPGGGVRRGVLLVEDHLLEQRQPAAAVLLGPAEAGPAVLGEVSVPGEPLVVGLVLTAGSARPRGARRSRR